MSSMRNAIARRNHKERAQPLAREKWGVLEKRKDYSLRAKDYNAKKARLKILRQKANDRNPDEFHFGMMSSRTDSSGRKTTERGGNSNSNNKPLHHDVVQLLKTQDAGYLRTMAQITRRAKEKVRQQFLLGAAAAATMTMMAPAREHQAGNTDADTAGKARARPRHIVFVENEEEQDRLGRQVEEEKQKKPGSSWKLRGHAADSDSESNVEESVAVVPPPPLAMKNTKRKRSTDGAVSKEQLALFQQRRYERQQERRALRLKGLERRERDLVTAEQELDLQRGRMNNAIGSVTKAGLKFKIRQRKR